MTKQFQKIFAKINFKGKSDSESVSSSVMSDSLRPHGRKEPSLAGSPVHGFLQVRILEWAAINHSNFGMLHMIFVETDLPL